MYTSVGFYKNDYFGEYSELLDPYSFGKYELKARKHLDSFTFGRLKNIHSISEDVEICMCEMMEKLVDFSKQDITSSVQSESTDGHSVTYREAKNQSQQMLELFYIAKKHLSHTGLLYVGVCPC